MKILLDHDMPKELRLEFKGHLALTARQMGWDLLSNGRLIAAAERTPFDVLLTADQRMFSQQNHQERRIALVVVTDSRMDRLMPVLDQIRAAIDRAIPGGFEEVHVPLPPKIRNKPNNV